MLSPISPVPSTMRASPNTSSELFIALNGFNEGQREGHGGNGGRHHERPIEGVVATEVRMCRGVAWPMPEHPRRPDAVCERRERVRQRDEDVSNSATRYSQSPMSASLSVIVMPAAAPIVTATPKTLAPLLPAHRKSRWAICWLRPRPYSVRPHSISGGGTVPSRGSTSRWRRAASIAAASSSRFKGRANNFGGSIANSSTVAAPSLAAAASQRR